MKSRAFISKIAWKESKRLCRGPSAQCKIQALQYIRTHIDQEKPDLLIGNSCGAFLAQMLSPVVGIPALLSNPHFKMTDFLKERIGEHTYKARPIQGRKIRNALTGQKYFSS